MIIENNLKDDDPDHKLLNFHKILTKVGKRKYQF